MVLDMKLPKHLLWHVPYRLSSVQYERQEEMKKMTAIFNRLFRSLKELGPLNLTGWLKLQQRKEFAGT